MEDKQQNDEEPRPDETSEDSRDSIILNTQERQTNERRLRLIRLIEIEQERLKYELILFLQEYLKKGQSQIKRWRCGNE